MEPLHIHKIKPLSPLCTAHMAFWRLSDISKNVTHSQCKGHGWPQRLHIDPCVHPLSSYCIVWDLTALLWRPHCALIRMPSQSVCFEQAHLGSAFYVTSQLYWPCHWIAAEMIAIVLHAPRHSAFFLDAVGLPWDKCPGVIGVLFCGCTNVPKVMVLCGLCKEIVRHSLRCHWVFNMPSNIVRA